MHDWYHMFKSILKLLKKVNLLKTFYFNFHYFPYKTAIRLPVFIYWRTELYRLEGRIIIDVPVYPGMIKLGPHCLGTKDLKCSRTMWDVCGTLRVRGGVSIGRGSKICIGENAVLTLGRDFTITGNSELMCQKEITFGSQCLLSWDILMMDTDWHNILNTEGFIINPPKSITIGNHVWIGCRSTILKGVSLADNVIVSANSLITRDVNESNCIIGGHGKTIEIIKKNTSWKY